MPGDLHQERPLARAFSILKFVSAQERSVSVGDIAVGTGLPVPTAHRLVGGLEEQGLLRRAVGSKRMELGSRMMDLGVLTLRASFRNAGRRAILRDLAQRLGEQCELGVLRDDQVVYVDSASPREFQGLRFDTGLRAPLHCSSTGKLFMSMKSLRTRERLVRTLPLEAYTDHTIVDADRLLADLDVTRKRGWAVSDQEFMLGVVGCAVPVTGLDGEFVAAIGMSAPVVRVGVAELEGFVPSMMEAALRLRASLADDGGGDAWVTPTVTGSRVPDG